MRIVFTAIALALAMAPAAEAKGFRGETSQKRFASVVVGAASWSGTFKTRAVLTRAGKKLDTCELKRVTWTATPTS
jgi:hypothetical protein